MSNANEKYKPLLDLSKSSNLHQGHYDEFIREVMYVLGKELKVSRSSFWTFNDEIHCIENCAMYLLEENDFEIGGFLYNVDFPSYFNAFKTSLIINAHDAFTDPRTCEFTEPYLKPKDIRSMLDIQVWVNGKLFGVICLEHTGTKRIWNQKDEIYITTAAAYISQSFQTKQRVQEEELRKLTETNYRILFNDSPLAMWVYDPSNFAILDVNKKAVKQYGYSRAEFLNISLFDLMDNNEIVTLKGHLNSGKFELLKKIDTIHYKKNGEELLTKVSTQKTIFLGERAFISMSMDITFEKRMQKERESLIAQLSDYAFFASHNLRAPVSSILGLVDLLQMEVQKGDNCEDTLKLLKLSSVKLDNIIRIMHHQLE